MEILPGLLNIDPLSARSALIGMFGVVVLGAYYAIVWMLSRDTSGKKYAEGTYEPPDMLSPGCMEYIFKIGNCSHLDWTSIGLISMAQKRYIRIVEEGGIFTLYRDAADPSVLSPDEELIADRLLSKVEKLALTRHSSPDEIHNISISLARGYYREQRKLYFPKVAIVRFWAWMITLGFTVGAIYPFLLSEDGLGPSLASLAFLIAGGTLWIVYAYQFADRQSKRRYHPSYVGYVGGPMAFAIACTLGAALAIFGSMIPNGISPLFLPPILLLWLGAYAFGRMGVLSPAGREMFSRIDAFRDYLAGKGSTESIGTQGIETFDRYFPYAVALGVQAEWAAQFPRESDWSPSWYTGTSCPIRTPLDLAFDLPDPLGVAVTQASSSQLTPTSD